MGANLGVGLRRDKPQGMPAITIRKEPAGRSGTPRLLRFARDNRGQAIVELSLVVALLFFLLLGIVEVGRVGHAYLTVVHASREGARLGALGRPDTEVINAVRRAAASFEDNLRVEISPGVASRVRGAALTVEVETSVPLIAPILMNMMPNPFPVSGKTVMRIE